MDLLKTLTQEDPLLVHYVRDHVLITPAPANLAYKLNKSDLEEASSGPTSTVLYILNEKVSHFLVLKQFLPNRNRAGYNFSLDNQDP